MQSQPMDKSQQKKTQQLIILFNFIIKINIQKLFWYFIQDFCQQKANSPLQIFYYSKIELFAGNYFISSLRRSPPFSCA